MTWCEKTIKELKAKQSRGEILTEDECESLAYAENVVQSEEAERMYLNGESFYNDNYYGSDLWLEDGYEAGYCEY